ncbi:hypothetical protein Tco_0710230 [Tanacetum coccineum]
MEAVLDAMVYKGSTANGCSEKSAHTASSIRLHRDKSHNVLGIAPVAIIDRQLPFEYTIASRSTDVMVMVLRVERKLFVIEQPISLASPTDSEYLCSGMRMRENQLAHMSLDEELCGTGMSWLCAPTRA